MHQLDRVCIFLVNILTGGIPIFEGSADVTICVGISLFFYMGFVMYIDASIKGLGFALGQEHEDEKLHLLAYTSKIIRKV